MSTTNTAAPRVVVFGSTNFDVSMRVHVLPQPGETVVALSTTSGLGGKGTNQAVAVARAGVSVALLSAVGADATGADLLVELDRLGVQTDHVMVDPSSATGRAHVTVDQVGENSIVVASGANGAVSADYALQMTALISEAQVLVVQGEVAEEATRESVRVARSTGTRIIANLAPYFDLGELAAAADPVVVNGLEASQLVGAPIAGAASIREHAARFAAVCDSIVVTLGGAGAVLCRQGRVSEFPARVPSKVVDTTGAGDAFVGVLAAGLARGLALEHACIAAVDAATSSVEVAGAAAAYPFFVLPVGDTDAVS